MSSPPQQIKQILIQKERNKSKTKQNTAATHQSVFYARGPTIKPTTPIHTLKPIELEDAIEYTLNLGLADPTYKSEEYAWLVLYNQQMLESFNTLRIQSDMWQLSMPAYESDVNVCDTYYSQVDESEIQQVITKFFEGDIKWRDVKKFEFDHELLKMNVEMESEDWWKEQERQEQEQKRQDNGRQ